jgi:hypothetical protein
LRLGCGLLRHFQRVQPIDKALRKSLERRSGQTRVTERELVNAVEIEEAILQMADQPFDPENFPYVFLEAFGNKETTIKRLRAGAICGCGWMILFKPRRLRLECTTMGNSWESRGSWQLDSRRLLQRNNLDFRR